MKKLFDADKFISSHNMRWERFPYHWYEGPFMGNGRLGALLYFKKRNHDLQLQISSNEVFDNRTPDEESHYKLKRLYETPRLILGGFQFDFDGMPLKLSMESSLLNAETKGKIGRSFSFSCCVPKGGDCIVFEYSGKCSLSFNPHEAISPRQLKALKLKDKERIYPDYMPPPAFLSERREEIKLHVQPFLKGGAYVIAYKLTETKDGGRLIISIETDEDEEEARNKAVESIISFEKNENEIKAENERFWRNLFSKGLIALPDKKLESFYYTQIYKLACAIAAQGNIPDTSGVWLTGESLWPGSWWNLNTQLVFSPLYASNHLDIAENLLYNIDKYRQQLIENVAPPYRHDSAGIGTYATKGLFSPVAVPGHTVPGVMPEAGNLTWILFYCYKHYLYSGRNDVIDDIVYPLLQRSVNYYRYFLKKESDQRLHLPTTSSPEYPEYSEDTTYDLALLRWGLKTLTELSRKKGEKEKTKLYSDILASLADYAYDENEGYMIGRDVHYSQSHRHFSHLLMLYPLMLTDTDKPEECEKVLKTLEFWHSKPEALEGYSHTGAASMYALLGDGNKAKAQLKSLFDGYITPNTMYYESGGPVLETPPAAACSLLDMLLLSVNHRLKIFPAVPEDWNELYFSSCLAEGGFEISAHYRDSAVQAVKIKANFEEELVFSAVFAEPERVKSSAGELCYLGDNNYSLKLKRGEETEISDCGKYFVLSPEHASATDCFGKI